MKPFYVFFSTTNLGGFAKRNNTANTVFLSHLVNGRNYTRIGCSGLISS
jgi:hypothetical protein